MGTKAFQLIKSILLLFFILIITGCNQQDPLDIAPNLTLSVQPKNIHYAPEPNSEVILEFDYPNDWILRDEEEYYDTGIYSIQIYDPRFIEVPTRVPFKTQGIPNNLGKITIIKQTLRIEQSLEAEIDSYRNGHNNESWIEPIKEYSIIIDGITAQVFEFKLEPFEDNSYSTPMFEKAIFFQVNQEIYQITFIEAINETGSEFENEFEKFLTSIRVFSPIETK